MRLTFYSLPLRYFAMVAQTASVSEAARQLHVAASAVSRQLARLEDELGLPLFERRPRGMALNAAGERLLAHVRAGTEEAGFLVEQLRGLGGQQRVRIACTEGFATGFMAATAQEFRRLHPAAQLELQVAAPAQINQLMARGEADVGLKYSLAPEKGVRTLLSVQAPVLAVVREGHQWARRRRISVVEAVECPLVLGVVGTTSRHLFDQACHMRGVSYVPAVVGNMSPALLSMLGAQDLMPAGFLTVAHEVAAGTLKAVPFEEPELQQRRLDLLVQQERHLLPPVQAFADLLAAGIGRFGKRRVRTRPR
ncbi:MAG: LysR family transcriptional regulator [Curvibacter sp.]|nr:LysR family transcriptional regulator [Curvibacter sp.]